MKPCFTHTTRATAGVASKSIKKGNKEVVYTKLAAPPYENTGPSIDGAVHVVTCD